MLYILIFTFLHNKEKTKDSELNGGKHPPNLFSFLFPHECKFWFVEVIPEYFKLPTV